MYVGNMVFYLLVLYPVISTLLQQFSSGINKSNGCTPFYITQPRYNAIDGDKTTSWALYDKTTTTNPIAQKLTIGLYYSNVRPSVSDQTSLFTQSHPLKFARLYAPSVEYQAFLDNQCS